MSKMEIVLEHATEGHDHGERLTVELISSHCEGIISASKEYINTDKGVFERYTCYSIISPYGWKKSDKTWEGMNV